MSDRSLYWRWDQDTDAVHPTDMETASRSLMDGDARRVDEWEQGGVRVSTVFLAIDHGRQGTPILFETLVFGGPLDDQGQRYATAEEARIGHAQMVRLAGGTEKGKA